MYFDVNRFLSISILCSCFLLTQKSYAFDYEKYNKEHRQLRSLTPISSATASVKEKKEEKSPVMKEFITKLLDAMQSDAVPAKLFDTNTNFSIYFKPAKISKIGITYKF
jgi:hypothetical protein